MDGKVCQKLISAREAGRRASFGGLVFCLDLRAPQCVSVHACMCVRPRDSPANRDHLNTAPPSSIRPDARQASRHVLKPRCLRHTRGPRVEEGTIGPRPVPRAVLLAQLWHTEHAHCLHTLDTTLTQRGALAASFFISISLPLTLNFLAV